MTYSQIRPKEGHCEICDFTAPWGLIVHGIQAAASHPRAPTPSAHPAAAKEAEEAEDEDDDEEIDLTQVEE